MDLRRVQILRLVNVRDHDVSSPDASCIQHTTDEDAWQNLFTSLVVS